MVLETVIEQDATVSGGDDGPRGGCAGDDGLEF